MFAGRTHSTNIKLKPDEEILYRLPPMSIGTVIVRVSDAYFTRGPHDAAIPHFGPTRDLELELRHSEHLKQPFHNFILTESLWQDNLWRLRVRRVRPVGERDLTDEEGRLGYHFEIQYTSQLPILERRVPASFFHDGFEVNWNQQQYIKVRLISNRIEVSFREDLAQIYNLPQVDQADPPSYEFPTGRVSFVDDDGKPAQIDMTSLRLDIGAGPGLGGGGNAVFFSARAEFPSARIKVDLPPAAVAKAAAAVALLSPRAGVVVLAGGLLIDPEKDLPSFHITVRLFLGGAVQKTFQYVPVVESNLLELLDFTIPDPGPGDPLRSINVKDEVKAKIEDDLFKLQVRGSLGGSVPSSASVFGDFLAPWLVGGRNELVSSIGYAPGPGDTLRPDGLVEPATGHLIVGYVGARPQRPAGPVLTDDIQDTPPPPDDGSTTPVLTVRAGDGTNPLGVIAVIANGNETPPASTTPATFTLKRGQPFTLSVPAKLGHLVFDSWSDGRTTARRSGSITTNTTLTATYLQRLFDLPDEEPDPLPGGGGTTGGGLTPVGGGGPHQRPNIGALAKIDHIVVLMQENRSFDQVLGYLSRDKINLKVDGLLPPDHPEHETQVNVFNGRNFFPQKADKENPPGNPPRERATAWPRIIGANGTVVGGPCHDTDCVRTQMAPNPEAPSIPMGGFVADFAVGAGETSPTGGSNPHLRLVMDYFDGEQLQFFDLLAREFAICDRWYTSHPGPTWPNRFVLLTGDLNFGPQDNVETDNPDMKTLIPIQTPTLFDHLTERGVSWRIFEHGIGFSRVFRNLTFDTESIVPFGDREDEDGFEVTARRGLLPQVTLIEPDYVDIPPGNDDHTPADMYDGQILVERIVKALIDSPAWDRTLFIITYDEHGGFYDHRPAPQGPPLLGGGTTLGPRVPTFFISPLVEPGAVFFGVGDKGRFFDHTSISATILRRFPGDRPPPRVSPRLDAARDLREVLTRAEPRPRADFDSIRQFTWTPPSSPERRTLRAREARAGRIGVPDKPKEDFHWLLSAVRLITGEPPKISSLSLSGQLLFYRDKTRDGTGDVANPSVIGLGGWQNFRTVFAGGNGVIYAVDQEGRLLFYQDKTQDGTGDVANPSVIGLGGWQNFKFLFSGGNRIIYAVDQEGRLLFYRDTTQNGIGDVANPSVIGKGGWQNFKFLFSGGNGVIYAAVAYRRRFQ